MPSLPHPKTSFDYTTFPQWDPTPPPPPPPSKIYYLTISDPQTDTFTFHGPTISLNSLLPHIKSAISSSPSAQAKLAFLRQKPNFLEKRFKRLVVPLVEPSVRDIPGYEMSTTGTDVPKMILKILTDENRAVRAELPGPVYTVLVQGPMVHTLQRPDRVLNGRPAGVVATSWIAGSFVDFEDAAREAKKRLLEMLEGEEGVRPGEEGILQVNEGRGRMCFLAMDRERVWRVYVRFEYEG